MRLLENVSFTRAIIREVFRHIIETCEGNTFCSSLTSHDKGWEKNDSFSVFIIVLV